MDAIKMETLATIVDEGSFEQAAYALGISPSAVSQRVKSLEKSTGRVLLRRTTPVTATDAGEVIVQAARRMALLQAETDAKLKNRLSRVPLSIAVNADSLSTWFRPVLAEMAQLGKASLRLRVEDESQTLALLRRGDVLGAVTKESTPVSGCEVTSLSPQRYLAVAAPSLVAEGINWATLPVLRFGPADGLQDQMLDRHLTLGERVERAESIIPDVYAFTEAICVGLGWALLPEVLASDLVAQKRLVVLDDEPLEVPLYWQRWRLESELLSALTQAVISAGTTPDA
ncbi:ArgP/LysG family DNA-binding transcriptional regulator [Corynebacterium breve]|uniref:ArgP/LysG family DNA-binding transcriptional regulator n=1 Tax=Corynebacterium breve TaxID=3049799 RepID=A0ABY8VHX9_9CORY|nr:ArgP/LysG family DNA-binding transcriptional regulator [Corynebacterium breve]WIM68672.1 ArgP/LysG family DNA-binding transcriptional regulator [Corynebacterium breve]